MSALEPSRDEIEAGLDPGIRVAVLALWQLGAGTVESCQGGGGHASDRPFITLAADQEDEALAAFRFLIEAGFPAATLNKAWYHCPDCYPALTPEWEIIFRD